jgi:hypothetical protein
MTKCLSLACPSGTIVRQAPLSNYSSRAFHPAVLLPSHVQFQLNGRRTQRRSISPLPHHLLSAGSPLTPRRDRQPSQIDANENISAILISTTSHSCRQIPTVPARWRRTCARKLAKGPSLHYRVFDSQSSAPPKPIPFEFCSQTCPALLISALCCYLTPKQPSGQPTPPTFRWNPHP